MQIRALEIASFNKIKQALKKALASHHNRRKLPFSLVKITLISLQFRLLEDIAAGVAVPSKQENYKK